MNCLFKFIGENLNKSKIPWYPHFGKFIGDGYKFIDCFDVSRYNELRAKVDPENIFLSKFN
jgi:hypothetical protein